METIVGPIGFTIPTQNLSRSQEVNMTPADIMVWRNHLPLADLGNSAKKIYHAISDCNKVKLDIKDRFEILELLRTPVQFICQSLRKHYINQTTALTQQQLSIVNLAQTLQIEMANGYKLIVEELARTHSQELSATILPIALQRIIHYFTYIIHRTYQLYSLAPPGTWKELHLVYKYAEKNHLLNQNNLENDYKHVLLLAATNPYQWRQTEQDALYSATEIWAPLTTLQTKLPSISEPGFLVLDFNDDKPPMSPIRGVIPFSSSCKVLDVNPILSRLKPLLAALEPNELQARIAHSDDPEYAVSTSVLRGIIQAWENPMARSEDRAVQSQQIKISIGLIATHYYLNNQRPFQPQPSNKMGADLTASLSTITIQEENADTAITNIELDKIPLYPQGSEKSISYPLYSCTLVNENPNGYGLTWANDDYPPIQAGEVIGIEKEENGNRIWEICKIRWLQHQNQNELRIGVQRLAKTAKAGAVQLFKEGKPAGYYLRCLLLESTLLVPTLPFKSRSQVAVIQDNNDTPLELELIKLVDATGSYKQFQFVAKNAPLKETPPPPPKTPPTPNNSKKEPKKEKGEGEDEFDSIWSNL